MTEDSEVLSAYDTDTEPQQIISPRRNKSRVDEGSFRNNGGLYIVLFLGFFVLCWYATNDSSETILNERIGRTLLSVVNISHI